MPCKKSNIRKSFRHAQQLSASRAAETFEQRRARLEVNRIKASILRVAEKRDSQLEILRMDSQDFKSCNPFLDI